MQIVVAKGISLAVILGLSLLFSMLPLKFISVIRHTLDPVRRRTYKRTLSFLGCFGGGVFLAACLLDLYPEVEDNLSDVFDRLRFDTSFPLVQFIVVAGFFVVFIVEQIVLAYKEGCAASGQSHERQSLLGHQRDAAAAYDATTSDDPNTAPAVVTYPINEAELSHSHDHSMLVSIHEDPNSHSSLRAIILLLAISIHSLFEGLAVGLQPDVEELLQLLSAVIIHKCIIALSLGMNLVQSRLKLRVIIFANMIFSVAAPLGLAIGMIVTSSEQSVETALTKGLLEGLACGTFLYVTFFEVIPHEMNDGKDRLLKVLFILLGYAAICAALFLDKSEPRPVCYRRPQ